MFNISEQSFTISLTNALNTEITQLFKEQHNTKIKEYLHNDQIDINCKIQKIINIKMISINLEFKCEICNKKIKIRA